jgi:hypothetical protein
MFQAMRQARIRAMPVPKGPLMDEPTRPAVPVEAVEVDDDEIPLPGEVKPGSDKETPS